MYKLQKHMEGEHLCLRVIVAKVATGIPGATQRMEEM